MADVLGTTLNILHLTRRVLEYVNAVKDGGKDREIIKLKIEAAGKIVASLNQFAKDAPQNSPSFQQLQGIVVLDENGGPALLSRFESLLCRIQRKLEPKGHDNYTLQQLRKIVFKATWPFEKDEVREMVRDLEGLQSAFQSVLQAVLGGMVSSVRESVNESFTVLRDKLDQVLGWQKEFHDSAEEDAVGSKIHHLQEWVTEFRDWKNRDVLGSKLDRLQLCLTEFLDWTHEDVLGRKLDRLQEGQDKLLRSQDEEDCRVFCSKLSNLSPAAEVESRLRECQGSEPNWIFDSPVFEDWVTDTSSRILWAKGNPGSGKSVLAAVVAAHLRETATSSFSDPSRAGERINSPKTCVAAFFFKYQESVNPGKHQERVNPDIMLKCIARQFLEQGGAELWLGKGVKYAASLDSGRFDVKLLLSDLLSHFNQVFLIIDALDECDVGKQDDTIDVLKSLLEMSPSLYVLVTSRADMERYFSDKGSLRQAKRIEVAARAEDVQAYVERWMEKIANRSDTALAGVGKKGRDEIAQKVVNVTEGIFLVAVRHMLTLKDCENQSSLKKAVSSLSSDLGKTYDEAIRRIFSQSESKSELGRRALLWVVNVIRPLRMTQLQEVLATYDSEGDLDEGHLTSEGSILAATKGLITVDREFGVLSIHKSLADYFDSKEKMVEAFKCDPSVEMMRICLKYLTFSRFSCGVVGDWEIMDGPHQLASLHRRVCHNPFSLYAAQCWGWHAAGDNEVQLMDEILRFFDSGGHLQSAIEIWACVGPLYRHRHYRYTDEFVAPELASYFGLENTRLRLLFTKRDFVDYSQSFVSKTFTWDELLAGLPSTDNGGLSSTAIVSPVWQA